MNSTVIILVAGVVLAGLVILYKSDIESIKRSIRSTVKSIGDVIANPQNVLLGLILLIMGDLLFGGPISTRIQALGTGQQVTVYLAILLSYPSFVTAKKLHSMIYTKNTEYMLLLDPRWGKGMDLVESHPEKLAEYSTKGARRLHKKPLADTHQTAYIARTVDLATKEILATWKAMADPADVEKSQQLLISNHKMLEDKLDEYLEVISSQPQLKRRAREDGTVMASSEYDTMDRFDDEKELREWLIGEIEAMEKTDKEATKEDVDPNFDGEDNSSDSAEGGGEDV